MALRTAMDWRRLAKQPGKTEAAHAYLKEICESFSEGFDTKRVRDAREMMDELG